MEEKNLLKCSNSDTSKQNLYRIGRILDLSNSEINATLKKKKRTVILAILLALAAVIMLTGCIHTMYTAVVLRDFSWIWRLI